MTVPVVKRLRCKLHKTDLYSKDFPQIKKGWRGFISQEVILQKFELVQVGIQFRMQQRRALAGTERSDRAYYYAECLRRTGYGDFTFKLIMRLMAPTAPNEMILTWLLSPNIGHVHMRTDELLRKDATYHIVQDITTIPTKLLVDAARKLTLQKLRGEFAPKAEVGFF